MESYENTIRDLEGVKHSFNNQWATTVAKWDDNLSKHFYDEFVTGYTPKIDQYISHANELGAFLTMKKKEIQQLAEKSR